ncbi:ATP synthase, F1 complex, gamma subunit [Nitrospina gracilis 3/211]|uniref:ATP synthase gamma chain n=1 Tax=Nitrospina gracilis (strain 3/211) TaxID=1266370 RepID=M1Z2W8_NITG3|nr:MULTISPECIES: ATP synthase F1 subunit gamma [Nitrospina]MCF8724657.1 F-type H+-transporting ATPase subunit gamma [Nitrospina sp. Nb-3]CCQ91839.1 ATP synthase, F1 complex, gamma subunit [Nitrospina gracilis 3/211]
MPNLRDVKNRIRSVKNTQQTTKAMKLVSASKLRRAQEAILTARPYATKMRDVLNHLSARCNHDLHPLLNDREGNKVLLVIITADRGLCGAFNANIIKMASQIIEENRDSDISLFLAGKKGGDYFKRRPYKIQENYPGWTKEFNYAKAVEIGEKLGDLFVEGTVDRIFLVYNEFKSVLRQEVIREQLLPIEPEETEDAHPVDYIYEPDEESILEDILKRYMTLQVYRAFLESSASEHGARMTAMDNASRNAKEMIGQLTLFYNRTRQAYITKELIEVVNGAEALKD